MSVHFIQMLENGTLEEVENPESGYYSRLFQVQKVPRWRLVIEMETVLPVLRAIRKADKIFSVDLKDYLQIQIHLESPTYLWVTLNRKVFQFRVTCFGLSSGLHEGVPSDISGLIGGRSVCSAIWTID